MSLPRPLSASVHQIAGQTIGRDWDIYATLLGHWKEIVGEELAEMTTPVRINFPRIKGNNRSDGTLVLRTPRGLALEIQHKIGQIQARLNAFMGHGAIARIVLEHDTSGKAHRVEEPEFQLPPQDAERIEKEVNGINDPELRTAAEALGQAIAQNAAKMVKK